MSDIEVKQNYLREEILEQDYNPDEFLEFLISKKGDSGEDLEQWELNELKEAVKEFKEMQDNLGEGNNNNNNNDGDYYNAEKEEVKEQQQQQQQPKPPVPSNIHNVSSNVKASTSSSMMDFLERGLPTNKNQSQPQQQQQQQQQQVKQSKPSEQKQKQQQEHVSSPSPSAKPLKIQDTLSNSPKSKPQQQPPQEPEPKRTTPTTVATPPPKDQPNPTILFNYPKIKDIQCTLLEQTKLGTTDNAYVQVLSPEKVEGGFFSKSYMTYLVSTIPLNLNVRRRYSDFEWLKTTITAFYPGIIIPPIPGKSYGDRFNEVYIAKRMRTLEKFINYLIHNPTTKHSQILYDFLSLASDDLFNERKTFYSKQKPPTQIYALRTLTGRTNIAYNELDEIAFNKLKEHAETSDTLFKKLNMNYKMLNNEMQVVSNRLQEISNCWKDLFFESTNYGVNSNVSKVYNLMSKFTKQWSESEKKQASLSFINLREYFKYINKEVRCVKELITKVDAYKYTYTKEKDKLMYRKEELFKRGEVQRWEVVDWNGETADYTKLLEDKKVAFEKMLPKETKVVMEYQYTYGCYLNKLLEEYKRHDELCGKTHTKAMIDYYTSYVNELMHLKDALKDVVCITAEQQVEGNNDGGNDNDNDGDSGNKDKDDNTNNTNNADSTTNTPADKHSK